MNTNRSTTLAAALALLAGLLSGCGDESHYDVDNAGVRRFGAPRPGSVDYGADSKALEIGEAQAVPTVPSETRRPTVPNRPAATSPAAPKASAYRVSNVENGATIRGVVRFSASPPAREPIPFTKDQPACGHDSQPTQRVIFDPGTLTVGNAFVYLADITTGKDFAGAMAQGEDEREALFDQKECTYVPHLLAVRTNTQVRIRNSDGAEHNVHMYRGDTSGPTQANVLSPAGSNQLPGSSYLEKPGVYEVKCDIHPWMNGYIWAMNHPYFAVTAKDGSFELKDVPPGTYTLVLWHEGMVETPQWTSGSIAGYDYTAPLEVTQTVTLAAGGSTVCDFVIDPPER